VIVGAPTYDDGQTNEGLVDVFYGSASGLSGNPGWTVERNLTDVWFGYSVAPAGDVNGDGYADIIVGAPHQEYMQTYGGAGVFSARLAG